MSVLECRQLYKSYGGNINVLENMNISIPEGKIIGLLGPNGCGKSTLIKMICGLLVPTSGEILVGNTPVGPQTKAMISYLPERTYFNNSMRIKDLIDFFCDFYADFDRRRAFRMIQDLKIAQEYRLRTLSK